MSPVSATTTVIALSASSLEGPDPDMRVSHCRGLAGGPGCLASTLLRRHALPIMPAAGPELIASTWEHGAQEDERSRTGPSRGRISRISSPMTVRNRRPSAFLEPRARRLWLADAGAHHALPHLQPRGPAAPAGERRLPGHRARAGRTERGGDRVHAGHRRHLPRGAGGGRLGRFRGRRRSPPPRQAGAPSQAEGRPADDPGHRRCRLDAARRSRLGLPRRGGARPHLRRADPSDAPAQSAAAAGSLSRAAG